jgi:hypothetical protein
VGDRKLQIPDPVAFSTLVSGVSVEDFSSLTDFVYIWSETNNEAVLIDTLRSGCTTLVY